MAAAAVIHDKSEIRVIIFTPADAIPLYNVGWEAII
jgi:hypothetical protein